MITPTNTTAITLQSTLAISSGRVVVIVVVHVNVGWCPGGTSTFLVNISGGRIGVKLVIANCWCGQEPFWQRLLHQLRELLVPPKVHAVGEAAPLDFRQGLRALRIRWRYDIPSAASISIPRMLRESSKQRKGETRSNQNPGSLL